MTKDILSNGLKRDSPSSNGPKRDGSSSNGGRNVILVLGNEGSGLTSKVRQSCEAIVSIPNGLSPATSSPTPLDSLNVRSDLISTILGFNMSLHCDLILASL